MPRMNCQCGQALDISDPIVEIVNQMTFSSVFINHGAIKGNVCPKCGQVFLMCIQGFNLAGVQLAMVPAPKQEEPSKIITDVPAGFNPRRPM